METLSPTIIQIIIQTLGLPGLVFVIWHFDNKRLDKQQALYRDEQQLYREMYIKEQQKLREAYNSEHRSDRDVTLQILNRYKEDINNIATLYKNNVHLVGDYEKSMSRLEKMAEEMLGVVSLNAQASTHLADAIKNNTFCPQVRKELGKI
jgi:hypothetical protein